LCFNWNHTHEIAITGSTTEINRFNTKYNNLGGYIMKAQILIRSNIENAQILVNHYREHGIDIPARLIQQLQTSSISLR
jgi:hypothetical protein